MSLIQKEMIYRFNSEQNVIEWMREKTHEVICHRYRAAHLAKDMDVTTPQMSRFLNGKKVNQDFIIKWFNYFT
ncbi:hypothetical protein UFOVP633_6 [uncultured Caudovirales phage]|uniref:Uncharacterized protein n=1 Tax=uncultured Caudovirales phage TaxID=2100421 RepID=A0A6J5N3M6_9CAUD|nr:hypothetical protein UFOVP633_6 [uncultured Caudovirales phage]